MNPDLLTLSEVAALLGISVKGVRSAIERGTLDSFRLGRGWIAVWRDEAERYQRVIQRTHHALRPRPGYCPNCGYECPDGLCEFCRAEKAGLGYWVACRPETGGRSTWLATGVRR
jgi:excisionase family DNA binding protein